MLEVEGEGEGVCTYGQRMGTRLGRMRMAIVIGRRGDLANAG